MGKNSSISFVFLIFLADFAGLELEVWCTQVYKGLNMALTFFNPLNIPHRSK